MACITTASPPNTLQRLEDLVCERTMLERLWHHTGQSVVLHRGSSSFPIEQANSSRTDWHLSVLLGLLIIHLDRTFQSLVTLSSSNPRTCMFGFFFMITILSTHTVVRGETRVWDTLIHDQWKIDYRQIIKYHPGACILLDSGLKAFNDRNHTGPHCKSDPSHCPWQSLHGFSCVMFGPHLKICFSTSCDSQSMKQLLHRAQTT